MASEMKILALIGLLLICSGYARALDDPTFGVFIRPDGIGNRTVAEVVDVLKSNGVGAVFYLTKPPLGEDEEARLLDLKSALDPEIQLHLWLTVYRNERYTEEHPEEAFISDQPLSERGWISPTSPRYRQDLLEAIGRLQTTLQPRGVLLDYFHVPFGPFDNDTMKAFSAHAGANLTVGNVTADPDLLGAFLEWRNEAILQTLRAIRDVTQDLELSIFVLMMEEGERLLAGQDLARFSGIADFLVPNTYHVNYLRNAEWVGDGVVVLKSMGAEAVWPGIQAFDIEPREMRKAIKSARDVGAEGFILFRYGTMEAGHWEEARREHHPRISPALLIGPPGLAILLVGAILWHRRRVTKSRSETSTPTRRKRTHRRR